MTIQPEDSAGVRLGRFFDFIWGDTQGVVYLPTASNPEDWRPAYFEWPRQRESVIQHVVTRSAQKRDVYYSPAIYRMELVDKLRRNLKLPKDQRKQVTKEDILGSHVLWVEFDGSAPDVWPSEVHEAGSETQGPAQGVIPPPPSMRIQSSGPKNQHCYWRLKEFCTDLQFIEKVNRITSYTMGADTSGWDINQVLRPIETVNYGKINQPKKTRDPAKVIIYDQTHNVYPISAFDAYTPIKDLIDTTIDDTNLPSAVAVVGKYKFSQDDLDLIQKDDSDGRDRSASLMRVGYACAELGVSDTEAYALLLFCDDRWGKFKNRRDRKRRLIDIINRAKQKIPHPLEELTFAGLLGTEESDPAEPSIAPKIIYGFQEILNTEVTIDWVVPDLIATQSLGLIVSAPNVGKTQFALNLGMACALKNQFLIWTPARAHRSLMFSLEMNLPHIKSFVTAMAPSFTPQEQEELQRNFLMAPVGMSIDLMQSESRKAFETLIEQTKPEGVYIDSLQAVYPKDMNADEIRTLLNYLKKVIYKYGIYIILIHHDRKAQGDNKRPRQLSDVYGSRFITAAPSFVVHMFQEETSQEIEVRTLKNQLAHKKGMFKIRRDDHLRYRLTSEPEEDRMGNAQLVEDWGDKPDAIRDSSDQFRLE